MKKSKKNIQKNNKPKESKKPISSISQTSSAQKSNHKLQPLHDRVLIKETNESVERTTSAGIIIPISVSEDKGSKQGVVVSVGAGRREDGKLIPVAVKVGDTVLFQWGDKVKISDEEYYLVRESEILAVINK